MQRRANAEIAPRRSQPRRTRPWWHAVRSAFLASDMPGEAAVFGPATRLVRSQALLRLHASRIAPVGLLAFGSRDSERFHPGQGTELLNFLARMLERLIRGWLHLPA